jgi:hypothetical protein
MHSVVYGLVLAVLLVVLASASVQQQEPPRPNYTYFSSHMDATTEFGGVTSQVRNAIMYYDAEAKASAMYVVVGFQAHCGFVQGQD